MIGPILDYLFPPKLPSVEEWSQHNATKATADGIIVANIVDSFARHFDDWQVSGLFPLPKDNKLPRYAKKRGGPYQRSVTFFRERINGKFSQKIVVTIKVTTQGWALAYDYSVDSGDFFEFDSLDVNGVSLDPKLGEEIFLKYSRLAEQITKTKEAAEKAKRELEHNERKWNLAESLLGMKRNEFGALVPAQQV